MQMPFESAVCPHCHSKNPAAQDFRERLKVPERYPRLKRFLRTWWQHLTLAGVIALVFLVTGVVYYGWLGHDLEIVPNPSFKVKVEHRVENGKVVLEGTVKNLGVDVPDLSLKSIRVSAVFGLDGGGRRVESVFPKSKHRGEGSLLRGESGEFKIEVPEDGVESATLSVEVVDLTCGQPSGQCPNPSDGKSFKWKLPRR